MRRKAKSSHLLVALLLSGAVGSSALRAQDKDPPLAASAATGDWIPDSGISLRVRFMVHPRRRRALIDTINREVIAAFTAAEDIDFAYNTLRVIPTPTDSAT